MSNNFFKKSITITIIVLFIGTSGVPSIVSKDNDIVINNVEYQSKLSNINVVSDFTYDLDGWTAVNDGYITWMSSGGNPGGYLKGHDYGQGTTFQIKAPSKFLGSWTGYLSILMDVKKLSSQTDNEVAQFWISGPNGSARYDSSIIPNSNWMTITVPIQQSSWVLLSGTWSGLISNVNQFLIRAEFYNDGPEDHGFDNIILIDLNQPPNTPSNPSPSDGATNVDINSQISWTCSDPDGDSLIYDVYFGTNSNPPLVSTGQSENYYDPPGAMNSNTKYYWKIVAEDEHGASTSGSVWSFTTGSDTSNFPPNIPSNPGPENGSINVPLDITLNWTGGDPNWGDTVYYDVYLEANNPNPKNKVSEDQTDEWYKPEYPLEPSTIYYWKIRSTDSHGSTRTGPIWHFITVKESVADLECEGELTWNNVNPSSTVIGSFKVKNIGDSNSEMSWEIDTYPEWGTWTFTPSQGSGLKPSDGQINVEVKVVAPKPSSYNHKLDKDYSGEVKIINSENLDDYEIIQVSMKVITSRVFLSYIFHNLLEWFSDVFSIM